jgi:hypothetical protein
VLERSSVPKQLELLERLKRLEQAPLVERLELLEQASLRCVQNDGGPQYAGQTENSLRQSQTIPRVLKRHSLPKRHYFFSSFENVRFLALLFTGPATIPQHCLC